MELRQTQQVNEKFMNYSSQGDATSSIHVFITVPMNHREKKVCKGPWVVTWFTVSQPVTNDWLRSMQHARYQKMTYKKLQVIHTLL